MESGIIIRNPSALLPENYNIQSESPRTSSLRVRGFARGSGGEAALQREADYRYSVYDGGPARIRKCGGYGHEIADHTHRSDPRTSYERRALRHLKVEPAGAFLRWPRVHSGAGSSGAAASTGALVGENRPHTRHRGRKMRLSRPGWNDRELRPRAAGRPVLWVDRCDGLDQRRRRGRIVAAAARSATGRSSPSPHFTVAPPAAATTPADLEGRASDHLPCAPWRPGPLLHGGARCPMRGGGAPVVAEAVTITSAYAVFDAQTGNRLMLVSPFP